MKALKLTHNRVFGAKTDREIEQSLSRANSSRNFSAFVSSFLSTCLYDNPLEDLDSTLYDASLANRLPESLSAL